ncbi:MAG: barstar family protein [Bacteroidia bacterium]
MNKRTITINGDKFSDLESFYDEMDRVLTKDLVWQIGHNLDAFNDLLRGDYGVYDYKEPVKIVWIHFSYSKDRLGNQLINTLLDIIASHNNIKFETKD